MTEYEEFCVRGEGLLRWLLAARWSEPPRFDNRSYGSIQSSLAANLGLYFVDGSHRADVVVACRQLRTAAYSFGSARDLLYADLAAGVAKKHLQNAARYVLPVYSQLPDESWSDTLKKPAFMRELWPSQHIFGEQGILQGRSAIVQMPTSAGKTRAVELVLRSAFFSGRASFAVVIAPFRALCTEITGWLRNAFRGEDVVLNELSDAMLVDYSALLADLLGGEPGRQPAGLTAQRQVIVVTPEKLLYVLRHSPELADAIGVVIYDEGHQFDTGQRGITYELLLFVPKAMKPELSMAKRVPEDVLNVLGIHFSGLVVESFAMGIQNQDVGNVALVVLLDQLLLLGRALNV
jgi:POLQ-like helicase